MTGQDLGLFIRDILRKDVFSGYGFLMILVRFVSGFFESVYSLSDTQRGLPALTFMSTFAVRSNFPALHSVLFAGLYVCPGHLFALATTSRSGVSSSDSEPFSFASSRAIARATTSTCFGNQSGRAGASLLSVVTGARKGAEPKQEDGEDRSCSGDRARFLDGS